MKPPSHDGRPSSFYSGVFPGPTVGPSSGPMSMSTAGHSTMMGNGVVSGPPLLGGGGLMPTMSPILRPPFVPGFQQSPGGGYQQMSSSYQSYSGGQLQPPRGPSVGFSAGSLLSSNGSESRTLPRLHAAGPMQQSASYMASSSTGGGMGLIPGHNNNNHYSNHGRSLSASSLSDSGHFPLTLGAGQRGSVFTFPQIVNQMITYYCPDRTTFATPKSELFCVEITGVDTDIFQVQDFQINYNPAMRELQIFAERNEDQRIGGGHVGRKKTLYHQLSQVCRLPNDVDADKLAMWLSRSGPEQRAQWIQLEKNMFLVRLPLVGRKSDGWNLRGGGGGMEMGMFPGHLYAQVHHQQQGHNEQHYMGAGSGGMMGMLDGAGLTGKRSSLNNGPVVKSFQVGPNFRIEHISVKIDKHHNQLQIMAMNRFRDVSDSDDEVCFQSSKTSALPGETMFGGVKYKLDRRQMKYELKDGWVIVTIPWKSISY